MSIRYTKTCDGKDKRIVRINSVLLLHMDLKNIVSKWPTLTQARS